MYKKCFFTFCFILNINYYKFKKGLNRLKKILFLLFGVAFLGFDALWICASYREIIEGVMPLPEYLCLIWFAIVGIIILTIAIRDIIIDIMIQKKGKETYGIVTKFYESFVQENTRTHRKIAVLEYTAEVLVISENEYKICKGIVKAKNLILKNGKIKKYKNGDFLKLKQYKSNIKIISDVDGNQVPYDIYYKLENKYQQFI